MSQIRYDQISTGGNGGNFKVGYFNLKNDGDEAVVRIMHDSVDTFDILTTHPIKVGDKFVKANCIRDPHDPIENCPFCKSGSKIQQRLFIHLIQYVKDDQGNVIPQGKVWERSASYAVTLKNLIDEYGPLSDCIFKIRRNGEAGNVKTTYSILYGNPQVYRSDMYKKDDTIFEDYKALGTAVLDKNFDEIAEFMITGEFPSNKQAVTPQPDVVPDTTVNTASSFNNAPTPPTARPVRYY